MEMNKEIAKPSWVRNTDEVLKAIDEDIKKHEAVDIPEWAREIERYSFDFYRKKYSKEVEGYRKAAESADEELQPGYLDIELLQLIEASGFLQ